MRILLSEREQELLDEASPYAERVFRHLRACMDLKSRIAGRGASKMSRAVLAIHCQYVPPRGSRRPAWKPSLRELDVLIDELERVGLVRRCAMPAELKPESRRLVVFFPAADSAAQSRSNEERYMSGIDERDNAGAAETKAEQGFEHSAGSDEAYMSGQPERDISGSQVIDRDTAREGVLDEKQALAVQLVVEARRLGVAVAGSAHPEVQDWVGIGVSLSLLQQGVAKARGYIEAGRKIPAKYLTQVLRALVREQVGGIGVCSNGATRRPRLATVGGKPLPGWAAVPSADEHRATGGAKVVNGEGASDDWIE